MAEASSTPVLPQSTAATISQDTTIQTHAFLTESHSNNPQPPPGFLRLLNELYPNGMEDMSSPDDWSNHTDWLHLDGMPEIDFDFTLSDFTQLADQLSPDSLQSLLNASNLNLPNYLTEQTMMGQPPWAAPSMQTTVPPTVIATHELAQVHYLPSSMPQGDFDAVHRQNSIIVQHNASPPDGANLVSRTSTPSEWIYPSN